MDAARDGELPPLDAQPEDAGDDASSASDAGWRTPCRAFVAGRTVGNTICEPGAEGGYTLFSPILGSLATYLVDPDGRVVHQWAHTLPPRQVVYLREDGRLVRETDQGSGGFIAGGTGGTVDVIAWDGTVEWSYEYFDDNVRAHHDVASLPAGNLVLVAWERVSGAEATAAGRRAPFAAGELWPDHLVEVHPEPDGGGSIVWEWHAWDHLVQNNDASLPTYGEPSENPGRIDIDVGGAMFADWFHINGIHYDAAHDQLLLSVRNTSEVWIVDHNTTTAEAAGPAGDLLYRWGNPESWRAGTPTDRRFYVQHDTQIVADGLPGAGHLLVFNNGESPTRRYSSVDELVLPRAPDGTFERLGDGRYGPDVPTWTYVDPGPFYSRVVGGAQRLRGGNTLICEGDQGRFFEVTPGGSVVWEYQVPIDRNGLLPQGSTLTSSLVYRAYRYDADYPGLAGRDLTPGAVLELP